MHLSGGGKAKKQKPQRPNLSYIVCGVRFFDMIGVWISDVVRQDCMITFSTWLFSPEAGGGIPWLRGCQVSLEGAHPSAWRLTSWVWDAAEVLGWGGEVDPSSHPFSFPQAKQTQQQKHLMDWDRLDRGQIVEKGKKKPIIIIGALESPRMFCTGKLATAPSILGKAQVLTWKPVQPCCPVLKL